MSQDDEATRVLPSNLPGELPVGADLNRGQYRIVRKIDAGGFGITYLARDNLGRDVALKECFPLGLAIRSTDYTVGAASEAVLPSFTTARRLFLREARLLAQLRHPNVVHVQTLFEENGTAYMAMDFIHGSDLAGIIKNEPGWLTPEAVVQMTGKLLDALAYVHDNGMLHRDIKPANIRIDRSDRPILIDFGAARQQTSSQTQKMGTFTVVSDGYSPHEFYMESVEQGPASDLYSLAATIYRSITGEVPPPSNLRSHTMLMGEPDPYKPLAHRFPDYDGGFLERVDQAMALSIRERPQSAREWQAALKATRRVEPEPAVRPSAPEIPEPPVSEQPSAAKSATAAPPSIWERLNRLSLIIRAIMAVLFVVWLAVFLLS